MHPQRLLILFAVLLVGGFFIAGLVAPNDRDRDVPGATTDSGVTALDD
jgi:hypothetical protein